jgi:GTP cyclohydrolase II
MHNIYKRFKKWIISTKWKVSVSYIACNSSFYLRDECKIDDDIQSLKRRSIWILTTSLDEKQEQGGIDVLEESKFISHLAHYAYY